MTTARPTALDHPERLRLARELAAGGEGTVRSLARRVGLPESTTSDHLARLRSAGLVRAVRWVDGRGRLLTLTDVGREALARMEES